MSPSETVTVEEMWNLFRESEKQSENWRNEAEIRRKEDDIRRKADEARRKADEARRDELNAMIQALTANVERVSRNVDAIADKWGMFVEGIVAPACVRLFSERGIPVHEVHQRVKVRRDDGLGMEVDVLVVNQSAVVLVEIKSTLTTSDVKYHLKRLSRFKEFFPRYGECRVHGAVAGIVMSPLATNFARKNGLFVIAQSGEAVLLDNPEDFKPKTW
ncbi:MAG: DUF3782 domain-containing protein [Magnetococcales bacterium]|nr:DUF3782 domain-containing protein [Magnetococcales bacterium]